MQQRREPNAGDRRKALKEISWNWNWKLNEKEERRELEEEREGCVAGKKVEGDTRRIEGAEGNTMKLEEETKRNKEMI